MSGSWKAASSDSGAALPVDGPRDRLARSNPEMGWPRSGSSNGRYTFDLFTIGACTCEQVRRSKGSIVEILENHERVQLRAGGSSGTL
jgi:hypothetical protein